MDPTMDAGAHSRLPETYEEYEKMRVGKIEEINSSEKRFVSISERDNSTSLSSDMIKVLTYGKYQTSWKGIERMKSCTDIVIYEELIWDVKPATIIEFGAFKGGSALWMADLVRSFEFPTHVYSIDVTLRYLHEKAKATNLTFIEGDCMKIEDSLTDTFLKKLPHPWVIVEDAHMNVVDLLEYLHGYMESGDYIIADDTNPKTPQYSGMGFCLNGWVDIGLQKMDEVRTFMGNHKDEYGVDCKYTDMFKYNGCWNINGFIKRL